MVRRVAKCEHSYSIEQRRDKFGMKAMTLRDEAQSLVELALTVPLFMLLLLASVEFARIAWAAVLTSNAARAGAQYGAQNPNTAADLAGIQARAASDGVNLSGLRTTSNISCACSNGTSISNCSASLTSCAAPATILNYVHVNTTSTVTPLIHYPGLPTSFTVVGQSTMAVEQ